MITDSMLESLKADFLEWTGGFEPETEDEINIYLEAAIAVDVEQGEARDALRQWMREANSLQIGGDVD